MLEWTPGLAIPDEELTIVTTRSGGPGGQNVNKVETRVEVRWNPAQTRIPEPWRSRLLAALAPRLSKEGVLRIVCSETRSQAENRALALARLQKLVAEAVRPKKNRRPSRPTRGSKERRLSGKRTDSRRKQDRRAPPSD
jgi:ribosome-associated protein